MPPEDNFPLFAEFFNKKLKERGYTLKQLSEISGISPKYLEQFAHGRFENLPATPYVHGYFTRLGPLLGFDAEEWWQKVKREDEVQRSGKSDTLPKNRFAARRGRVLAGLGAVLLVVVLYLGLRASRIVGRPDLSITAPAEDTLRIEESHILVAGRMKNGDEVDIQGEPVALESDGSFHKSVSLEPGMNTIEIVAKKVLGRQVRVVKQVYYEASAVQILFEQSGASATGSVPFVTSTPDTL